MGTGGFVAGSFMREISNWETKSVVAIDRDSLFQDGLLRTGLTAYEPSCEKTNIMASA